MTAPLKWDVESARVKREVWVGALQSAHGNISAAARAVGIKRRHATNLMNAYGLAEEARGMRAAAWKRKGGMGRPPKLGGVKTPVKTKI